MIGCFYMLMINIATCSVISKSRGDTTRMNEFSHCCWWSDCNGIASHILSITNITASLKESAISSKDIWTCSHGTRKWDQREVWPGDKAKQIYTCTPFSRQVFPEESLSLAYNDELATTLESWTHVPRPATINIAEYVLVVHRLVFSSSTINLSTCDSSIIFEVQLLIASHKQFRGEGSGGQSPQF